MESATPPASTPGLADAQFRALAETAPDAIVTGDTAGRIAYANPAAERLFGYPADRMVGQAIRMLMPDEFRAAHSEGYGRFIETGRATLVGRTVELTGLRADGHRFPMELSLGSTEAGGVRTLTAVIRDLSDRRRRERHLAAQLAVTRVLAAGHPTDEAAALIVEELTRALGWDVGVLWLTDPAHGPRLELRHVWQADADRTRGFGEATARLALEPTPGVPAAILEKAAPAWLDDLSVEVGFVRHREAAEAGLRAGIWLPLMTEGRATGVIECFTSEPVPVDDQLRDLLMTVASQVGEYLGRRSTEMRLEQQRERFADELARSNDELEQFAQIAAHDLQTPLRTVAGFAELVLRDHRGDLPARAQEYLEAIVDSATGGGRMLDSLLSYARVGSSHRPFEPTQPAGVLATVLTALSADIAERRPDIRVGELPTVRADAVQLGQLLQNLIANALKFTPPDRAPAIVVEGERDGAMVRFSVQDNGIGIAAKDADGLFTMFRRGHRGGGYGGAGIGLAVCARIAERHGGRIWCAPVPDGGTVFSFTMPAA